MDVLQSHHRDIPEQKDEKEEDQTGENQESDEDSLLGFNLQKPLLLPISSELLVRSSECLIKVLMLRTLTSELKTCYFNKRLFPWGSGVRKEIHG